jgi:hypothetical protein
MSLLQSEKLTSHGSARKADCALRDPARRSDACPSFIAKAFRKVRRHPFLASDVFV